MYRHLYSVGQDSLLKPCALCTSNHVHMQRKRKSEHIVQEMSPFERQSFHYLPLVSLYIQHTVSVHM